jgi:hypothetical protein
MNENQKKLGATALQATDTTANMLMLQSQKIGEHTDTMGGIMMEMSHNVKSVAGSSLVGPTQQVATQRLDALQHGARAAAAIAYSDVKRQDWEQPLAQRKAFTSRLWLLKLLGRGPQRRPRSYIFLRCRYRGTYFGNVSMRA